MEQARVHLRRDARGVMPLRPDPDEYAAGGGELGGDRIDAAEVHAALHVGAVDLIVVVQELPAGAPVAVDFHRVQVVQRAVVVLRVLRQAHAVIVLTDEEAVLHAHHLVLDVVAAEDLSQPDLLDLPIPRQAHVGQPLRTLVVVSHLEDPAQDGQKMLASALPCSERRDDDLLTQAERRSHHSAAQRGEVVLVGAPDLLDQSVEPQTSQHP